MAYFDEGPMTDEMLSSLLSYTGKYPQEYMRALYGPSQIAALPGQTPVSSQQPASAEAPSVPTSGNFFINNATGKRYDFPESAPQPLSALLPDYSRPVEVAGTGKGYWAKGGSGKIVLDDGRIADPMVDREATDKRNREKVAMEKAILDNEFMRAKIAAEGRPARGVAQLTEIVDPTDPSRTLRIDVNSYRGGGVGSPGVVGISGTTARGGSLTEAQGKATSFASRARNASDIIEEVGKGGEVQPGLLKRVGEAVPLIGEGLGTMLNATQSPAQQQIEQAQRDFVNAVLRQESGAAINESEFQNAKKQYFPQPGDSPEVVAQKNRNREIAIQAFEVQAGPGMQRMRDVQGAAPRTVPANSVDQQETLFNAKKAIARNPAAREAIIQKMQANGYDTRGL